MFRTLPTVIALLTAPLTSTAAEPKAPDTVTTLWADFDPRKDALDAKLVREWEKDGVVYRTVTFHVGTFKGKPARIAAFYAFPKGAKKLPGLLHLHGGGPRPPARHDTSKKWVRLLPTHPSTDSPDPLPFPVPPLPAKHLRRV